MASEDKPKLFVFDLDYTLWPFYCDCSSPPFSKRAVNNDTEGVIDSRGRPVKLFPDTKDILHQLHKDGHTIGIASRTSATAEAESLLELFDLNQYITYKQIYPGCKITHFEKLCADSGLSHEDMIFFDDEERNIIDLTPKGVTCVLVEDELTFDVLQLGLHKHKKKKSSFK